MSNNNEFFSRRLFLTRGVQLLSVAGTVPMFLDRSGRVMAAEFAANPQGVGRPDKILVVLQLAGGNDGLNTVVPISNDDYYKARPRLGIAKKSALKVNDDFGFHPNASGLKKMFEDGHMAVLHAVGYPNPNRSHFRGTDIWATAEPNAAVALTNDPPTALQGEKYLPIAFRNLEGLTYRSGARDPSVRSAFEKLNDVDTDEMHDEEHKMMQERQKKLILPETGAAPREQTEEFLQRTALNARIYADQIRKTAANVKNSAVYPQ